ncbi:hypothetical protein BC939DRAFT_446579 [Gamsiella multidivaricata]|uniref:uncharacterized protein n=1 Tax=Gamsiella multidivaricata TaxID=101098 RepID=UPI002220DE30|nr:uncharacterized protein BC939DRAFT_446579 [Gamsiella multidivaricata]KAI7826508.1 hypothetical protein BC939DRAFT_446579 [Gamsiella multidivaricata]
MKKPYVERLLLCLIITSRLDTDRQIGHLNFAKTRSCRLSSSMREANSMNHGEADDVDRQSMFRSATPGLRSKYSFYHLPGKDRIYTFTELGREKNSSIGHREQTRLHIFSGTHIKPQLCRTV